MFDTDKRIIDALERIAKALESIATLSMSHPPGFNPGFDPNRCPFCNGPSHGLGEMCPRLMPTAESGNRM